MRISRAVSVLFAGCVLASPMSLAGGVDCPKTTAPSFNDCITVSGCTYFPFPQSPYPCAYSYCESILWFPGPPGRKVLLVETGLVPCKVRRGVIGPTGECLGADEDGDLLEVYWTQGITKITVGAAC